jgi:cell wall-associated NlpC family hydrolase
MIDLTRYIGIPYVDKGQDPAMGLDCWQLVRHFYRQELGVDVPDYLELYASSMDKASVKGCMAHAFGEWQRVDYPAFGDVLVFRVTDAPWHTGIYLGPGRMLHSLPGHNSCLEAYDGTRWKHRLHGVYRWNS